MRWLTHWFSNKSHESFGGLSLPPEEALRLRSEVVRQYAKGRLPEAVNAATRLVDWQRRTLGPGHADVAIGLDNLGVLLFQVGDVAGAAAAVAESRLIRQRSIPASLPGPRNDRLDRPTHGLAVLELLDEFESHPPNDPFLVRACVDSAREWRMTFVSDAETSHPIAQLLDRLEHGNPLATAE